jgi:hypothetical protein
MSEQMTRSAAPAVVIRPPNCYRVFIAGFMVLWIAAAIGSSISAAARGSWAIVPIVLCFVAVGCAHGWRMIGVSVEAGADILVVRNYFRTRRIPRQSIEGFRVGTTAMGPKTVVVLVDDGTVLSTEAPMLLGKNFGRKERLDDVLAQLRGWLNHG